jgi:hypothetical protein
MTDLLPTFHCFDDALEYLNKRVLADRGLVNRGTLELVHGLMQGDDGTIYAHAWCEEDGHCWDSALLDGQVVYYAVATAEYYRARQVQDTTRYTVTGACLMNLATGHYGPWVPRYRACCGGGGKIMGRHEADASQAQVRDWKDE